eukprot:2530747-Karenia_brevis.AAC.1
MRVQQHVGWGELSCAADKEQFVAAWVAQRRELPSQVSRGAIERSMSKWLRRSARQDFRIEMRALVAGSFCKFTGQVREFMQREGRPPSRYSKGGDERHLGEQVHNCLSGHRKLEPEQIEEL